MARATWRSVSSGVDVPPSIFCRVVRFRSIQPGGRSGRLQFQGGQVIYVWAGRGHTLLDGVRHPWEAGDVINLPLRTEGITVQHFNDGDDIVRLVCSEANLVHSLGVDRGVGYEVLENARD